MSTRTREELETELRKLAERFEWEESVGGDAVDADGVAAILLALADGESAEEIGDGLGLPSCDPDGEDDYETT